MPKLAIQGHCMCTKFLKQQFVIFSKIKIIFRILYISITALLRLVSHSTNLSDSSGARASLRVPSRTLVPHTTFFLLGDHPICFLYEVIMLLQDQVKLLYPTCTRLQTPSNWNGPWE